MTGDPVNLNTCTCPMAWWGTTPPPLCDACRWRLNSCAPTYYGNTSTKVTTTWPPTPAPLPDADVERIAKRVVELLKADK